MAAASSGLTQQAIEEYQAFICQLEGVISTHFVLSDDGQVEELHVLAYAGRNAKQLARDIQSALMARYHLEIDHRVISIAQIHQELGPTPPELIPASQPIRLVCNEVSSSTNRDQTRIEITLSWQDQKFHGQVSGTNNPHSRHRLVCNAVLDAVHHFLTDEATFSLIDLRLVELSGHTAVLVSVAMRYGSCQDLLLGAAYDDDDVNMAITKATLDAINRRLSMITQDKV